MTKNIGLIADLDLGGILRSSGEAGNIELKELFNDPFRRIVEVRLKDGAVLSKHKALEPITVLCLGGKANFLAGSELEDEQRLLAGTLIELGAGIEHEVVADPAVHLIVTKYKGN